MTATLRSTHIREVALQLAREGRLSALELAAEEVISLRQAWRYIRALAAAGLIRPEGPDQSQVMGRPRMVYRGVGE